MSEMLKANTTLSSLHLECEEEERTRKGKERNDERSIGNVIGDDGAKSMSEMLKMNITLSSLGLGCEKEGKTKKEK